MKNLIFKQTLSFFADFFNLFFPNVCEACGDRLLKNENIICIKCLYDFPKTNFHLDKENPITHLFYGRANIENATSLYFFNKGSKFQDLIHKLKYNGKKEIGFELGKQLGAALLKSENYHSIDVIIPVPLHPKKERKRGYNQSYWIALGINEIIKKEIDTKTIIRYKEAESQTKKNRFERYQNVSTVFTTKDNTMLIDKHILLVDDVITTGATLEACANLILSTKNAKVSIATLAVAN